MGIGTQPQREFLTREEAAQYITRRYFPITARTLAVYASDDRGPPYRLFGSKAQYRISDIDGWIERPEHYGNVAPKSQPIGALAVTRR